MTSRPTKPLPPLPPGEPERERRRSPMRAPRSQKSWEPVPLHVPVPERPSERPARNEDPTPRGVVIIDYGSD